MALTVEVVYALPGRADVTTVRLPEGATVQDALEAAGTLRRHPELGARPHGLGIFGKPAAPQAHLCDGDRVEVYRPLASDPNEARRRRAARKRTRV